MNEREVEIVHYFLGENKPMKPYLEFFFFFFLSYPEAVMVHQPLIINPPLSNLIADTHSKVFVVEFVLPRAKKVQSQMLQHFSFAFQASKLF